ncbi:putative transcriptional regulatory protein [Vanrija pseudolonga]|uniref:Purtative transcriptional regulatory protein n=1 Tax=Vanrija pseudolonga TaxID=143232 RepID=A0AAF1BNF2_9TREE|nr:purtative transcriptional regulatory protein [Vanrija pseudolonga]
MSSAEGRAPKRRRVQPIVSCLECRRMKWKCDREFPCANCRKRGIGHMCPGGMLQPMKGRQAQVASETSALQAKVQELEQALAAAQSRLAAAEVNPRSSSSQGLLTRGGVLEGHGGGGVDEDEDDNDDDEVEPQDKEFGHGRLVVGADGYSTFYGNAGEQYILHSASDRYAAEANPFIFASHGGQTVDRLVAQLPRRDDAARWATLYFEAGLFFALLDKFYDGGLPHSGGGTTHQLAVVFLVIASGAAMDLELSPYNDIAEKYFLLGRSSLAINSSSSITLVQAINLMSRHISNTFKGPKATESFWNTLGLHRDGHTWDLEPEEVERRRRVFWEIYSEDVWQSMILGRPRLISAATVDCAFPSPTSSSSEDVQFMFHEYKQYRLVKILARVNDMQTQVAPIAYRKILEVHRALMSFESDLPALLHVDAALSPTTHHRIHFQRLTLKLLAQEGYMFLHRAYFARALRDFAKEPLASTFGYVIELEASRVVLSIFRDSLAVNSLLACRFWIFFFHAFTAVVNFAAVVVRSPTSSLAAAALVHVEQGLALFESIPEGFRSRDDLPVLRRLAEQARLALRSVGAREPHTADDIIGIGTKLVRMDQPAPPQDYKMPTTLDEAVAVAHQVDIEHPEPPASEPGQEWWCPIPEATLFDLNSSIGSLEASLDLDEYSHRPY